MERSYEFESRFDFSGLECEDWMPADELQYCQIASDVRSDEQSCWALAGTYPQ